MPFILPESSVKRLAGVNDDLVRVVYRAASLTSEPFAVLEGLRTLDRQRQLYRRGATRTMHSRHLTGHAVDLAPLVGGKPSWHWPHYFVLAEVVKAAAEREHVPIEWGGDWTRFKDGPHWQLPWARYPVG